MNDNVIQFPKTKAANDNRKAKAEALRLSQLHYEDMANEATTKMVDALVNHGYHPIENSEMIQDLGVIMNLIVAMMYRVDGEPHFLHEPLEEIHEVIKYVKELKDQAQKDLFTDEE